MICPLQQELPTPAPNKPEAMTRVHRPLRLIVTLLFSMSLLALGFVEADMATSAASPVLRVSDVPLATTTTPAPPTTVAAPRQLQGSVVRPPKNDYAPEPIVQIGSMEIPKIGLNTPIFHGITLRNIDKGPSHWPGTAMPGEIGNSVFPGHRTTHSKPFRNVDQLVPGDEVIFNTNGARHVYRVTGHEIVTPDALWIANQTPTATATIFGCHPPGSARYRYVVRMALVQP